MRHDSSIPYDTLVNGRQELKESRGSFWSSVFEDQGFVDAVLDSRVASAAQFHIDAMEALSLRDHTSSPVFHREHWYPVAVRLSEMNTGVGVTVGMEDTPQVGSQTGSGTVYLPGEVFVVGGNAVYSKVNTYPIRTLSGCPLVNVRTGIFDSISNPTESLVQGRDFKLRGDVLVIRKEKDPFSSGAYRIVEEGDDRVAVLWVCDGEFDTDNVSSFVGYPIGVDVPSTAASSSVLSSLWDLITYGVTPRHLNYVPASVFDVPVSRTEETVESVSASGGVSTVVTDRTVYRIDSARVSSRVVAGYVLRPGDFLTDEVRVYHGLSRDEVSRFAEDGSLGRLSLAPGSVLGVSEAVTLECIESPLLPGGWFRLNTMDSWDSPFWTAVRSRTTADEREAAFYRLSGGSDKVNPLKAIGYVALANTVLVMTSRSPIGDPCAGIALGYLNRLVPASSSLLVVQSFDPDCASVDAEDSVEYTLSAVYDSSMDAASDVVSYRFVPTDVLEV